MRALVACLTIVVALGCGDRPPASIPTELVYLDQGWSDADRAIYYYTPQGTELHGLRYEWFDHLEMPFSRRRLAAPRNLASWGFLYDPKQLEPGYERPPWNPANLPVGFTMHVDRAGGEALLGLSCATCHTGQIEYGGRAIRIDGGQAMHEVTSTAPGSFVTTLLLSLQTTYAEPFKFDRFARRVLGVRYPEDKTRLAAELATTIDAFAVEGYHALARNLYPTMEGPGRTDALGHIANTVFGDEIDPDNYRVANAPVSYPHVWDIWKFDWVQWNGSVAQPMARNVGEALGVKARLELVDDRGRQLPPERRYDSSVLIPELHCIETTLWKLRPPPWDERYLPPVDVAKAIRGRTMFQQRCQGCHGPHVVPPEEHPDTPKKPIEWAVVVKPTTVIGTDPTVVNNFLDYRYDARALDPGNPALESIDGGDGLSAVTAGVIERKYAELKLTDEQKREYDGFGRKIEVRTERGYKARPLHGIWATPPFLHNGSVPTIYELLLPEERRSRQCWVGSRQYDPVHLGYVTTKTPGAFLFKTTVKGNANTGHQFRDDGGPGVIGRALSDDERWAIIEYLKVMGDPRFDDTNPKVDLSANCPKMLQGPARFPEQLR